MTEVGIQTIVESTPKPPSRVESRLEHTTANIEIIGVKPKVIQVETGVSPEPANYNKNQTLDVNAIDLKSLEISPKTKLKI